MSQESQSRRYEENYAILERITESLNKDEVGIDDLVEKTREALDAARTCMEILNKQKGEFKKLETEFSQLLQRSAEPGEPPQEKENGNASEDEEKIGEDDPF
ncbi:MAG: exodeoxyribonuclease VII small subunit [Candidatus Aminicenantes bacterium]|nr:MAG: exodeoxyribonuclease VII small subunit [Candidatus Aminicenantes bacterium]